MSITSGFFNSLSGDRKYNAEQMSNIFDGIINDGIFQSIGTALVVKADEGNQITVGIGRAWFNHTWTYNDSILVLNADDSEVLLNRIDSVVLEVNSTEGVRENTIKIIKGTPASEPVAPELIDEGFVHQHVLAEIYRAAGSENITQSVITNKVGTDSTPFVTGILKTISLDTLLGQWQNELDIFVDNEKASMEQFLNETKEWVQSIKDLFDENVQVRLVADVEDLKTSKADNAIKITVNLLSANWVGDSSPYSYTITNAAYKSNTDVELIMAEKKDMTDEQIDACFSACIANGNQNEGSITIYAYGDNKPTVDFPIITKVTGDGAK